MAYYGKQREHLQRRADAARIDVAPVIAAFCALSPNNAESTNYRALDTCLEIVAGRLPEDAKVIAYPPNKVKALAMLRGAPIDDVLRGRKVYSFYRNTLDPSDNSYVTVDGHMLGAWAGKRFILRREAEIKASEYAIICDHFRSAAECFKLPAPMFQAILWLTWKRKQNILWTPPQLTFQWAQIE